MVWLYSIILTNAISSLPDSDVSVIFLAATLYKLQFPKCHRFPKDQENRIE